MSTLPLTIRPARVQDNPVILKIIKELDLAYPAQTMANFLVAVSQNEIVGIVDFEEFDSFSFLSSLGVSPGWQNKGIAKALLTHLLAKATKDIYLYTTIPGFFQRFGFLATTPLPQLPSKRTFSCHECTPQTCVTMVRKANK